MPRLAPDALERLTAEILTAGGIRAETAAAVAAHLVLCDLKGVHSHGCSRIPYYLGLLAEGLIDGAAQPTVEVAAGPTVLRVDGHKGFGIPAMELAVERLGAVLQDHPLAAAGIVNCAHTGRIGAYAETLAARNCLAIVFGGGAFRRFPTVAPYGGRKGVLTTNPYALALPGGAQGPLVVDFATSATAQGKIMVARMKGAALPEGLIQDSEGRPSTDPNDYYEGGSLLPAAGPKGGGLALIAELVGDALLGPPHELNWLILALRLDALGDSGSYREAAESYLAMVQASPPAAGFERVTLPGQLEREREAERRRNGVPIDEEIWAKIVAEAERLGVTTDLRRRP